MEPGHTNNEQWIRIIVKFRQWRRLRKLHASNFKKKVKTITRNWFWSNWPLWSTYIINVNNGCKLRSFDNALSLLGNLLLAEPRKRISLNLLLQNDASVNLLLDETVDGKWLFCLKVAPTKPHLSMRFILPNLWNVKSL